VRNFEDLDVWRKAHELTLDIYRVTEGFPRHEEYGLRSQIRRGCTAIAANIAEGCGCAGNVELARYLQMARSSASELQYHLRLARDLGYFLRNDYEELLEKLVCVEKMLTSFRRFVLKERSQSAGQS
jgi:four helix bundle protein